MKANVAACLLDVLFVFVFGKVIFKCLPYQFYDMIIRQCCVFGNKSEKKNIRT